MGDENDIMTAACSSAIHVAEMVKQGILTVTITLRMITITVITIERAASSGPLFSRKNCIFQ